MGRTAWAFGSAVAGAAAIAGLALAAWPGSPIVPVDAYECAIADPLPRDCVDALPDTLQRLPTLEQFRAWRSADVLAAVYADDRLLSADDGAVRSTVWEALWQLGPRSERALEQLAFERDWSESPPTPGPPASWRLEPAAAERVRRIAVAEIDDAMPSALRAYDAERRAVMGASWASPGAIDRLQRRAVQRRRWRANGGIALAFAGAALVGIGAWRATRD